MQIRLKLPIKITYEEDLIIAICPTFNIGSQGKTLAQSLKNAQEALELYLEDEDVQRQNLEKIFFHALSIKLTNTEKKFINDLDIPSDPQVSLNVDLHVFPETSNPVCV